MSQYLDRKQVIELYEKYQPCMATRVYDFGEALRKLPVVEERPCGEWIRQKTQYDYAYTCECSLCGRVIYAPTEDDLSDFPYCHCGAVMRKER